MPFTGGGVFHVGHDPGEFVRSNKLAFIPFRSLFASVLSRQLYKSASSNADIEFKSPAVDSGQWTEGRRQL